MSIDQIPGLVRELHGIVHRLEDAFPGRKFTPDGHLVGSLGEVLAAHRYSLELLPASAPGHDAKTADGVLVQIKATQARSVGLRAEPEYLIVLSLSQEGEATEVFNGPGAGAWQAAGRMQNNGQRNISLTKLREIMNSVSPESRLPERG